MEKASMGCVRRYSRRDVVLLAMLAFILFTHIHRVAKAFLVDKNFCDIASYYVASKDLGEGKDIYFAPSRDISIPNYTPGAAIYSPVFYLFLRPLTFLPYRYVPGLWLIAGHIALFIVLFFSFFLMRARFQDDCLLALLLGMIYIAPQYLLEDMGAGNINIFLLALLMPVVYYLNAPDKDSYTGMLLSCIAIIKPQFGLLVLFYLWNGRFKFFLSSAIGYIFLRLAGIYACGINMELAYWKKLIGVSAYKSIYNLSIKGFLERLLCEFIPEQFIGLIFMTLSFFILLVTFYAIKKNDEPDIFAQFSVLLSAILLISPFTEEHHLLFLAIAMLSVISRKTFSLFSAVLFIFSFTLICTRYSLVSFSLFAKGPMSVFAHGKTLGMLLLWFLQIRMLTDNEQECHETLAQTGQET